MAMYGILKFYQLRTLCIYGTQTTATDLVKLTTWSKHRNAQPLFRLLRFKITKPRHKKSAREKFNNLDMEEVDGGYQILGSTIRSRESSLKFHDDKATQHKVFLKKLAEHFKASPQDFYKCLTTSVQNWQLLPERLTVRTCCKVPKLSLTVTWSSIYYTISQLRRNSVKSPHS